MQKALELLHKASNSQGFLASTSKTSNYQRIWARDGVICGLAALLSGDKNLIETFKKTLETLSRYQHDLGHIPSNVHFLDEKPEVSFGGLAGRVDTISWYIIGICNYAFFTKKESFLHQNKRSIEKGFELLSAWEFNNNHLLYVPRSGNWADEYITEGHILYDQLLRLWALKCYLHFYPNDEYSRKKEIIEKKLIENYKSGETSEPYHPKAYKELNDSQYWQASINPSGYQKMFDAFANSLALMLNLGDIGFQEKVIYFSEKLRNSLPLKLLPAFWETIKPQQTEWELLLDNCKYEFRNHPYEFHNGGTWQMVNGFYGIGVFQKNPLVSKYVLDEIKKLNKVKDYSFYENFNTKTQKAIGVPYCSWSAAAEVMLEMYLKGKKLLI